MTNRTLDEVLASLEKGEEISQHEELMALKAFRQFVGSLKKDLQEMRQILALKAQV